MSKMQLLSVADFMRIKRNSDSRNAQQNGQEAKASELKMYKRATFALAAVALPAIGYSVSTIVSPSTVVQKETMVVSKPLPPTPSQQPAVQDSSQAPLQQVQSLPNFNLPQIEKNLSEAETNLSRLHDQVSNAQNSLQSALKSVKTIKSELPQTKNGVVAAIREGTIGVSVAVGASTFFIVRSMRKNRNAQNGNSANSGPSEI